MNRFFALFLCVVMMLSIVGCKNNDADDPTFIKHNILATYCRNNQDGSNNIKINMKSVFNIFNLQSVSYTKSFVSSKMEFLDYKDIIGLWLSTKPSIEFVINDEVRIPYANYGHIYTIEFNDDEWMTVSHIGGYIYIQTYDHKYVSKTPITKSGLER